MPDKKDENKFMAMLERRGIVRKVDAEKDTSKAKSDAPQKRPDADLKSMLESSDKRAQNITPAARQPVPGMINPVLPATEKKAADEKKAAEERTGPRPAERITPPPPPAPVVVPPVAVAKEAPKVVEAPKVTEAPVASRPAERVVPTPPPAPMVMPPSVSAVREEPKTVEAPRPVERVIPASPPSAPVVVPPVSAVKEEPKVVETPVAPRPAERITPPPPMPVVVSPVSLVKEESKVVEAPVVPRPVERVIPTPPPPPPAPVVMPPVSVVKEEPKVVEAPVAPRPVERVIPTPPPPPPAPAVVPPVSIVREEPKVVEAPVAPRPIERVVPTPPPPPPMPIIPPVSSERVPPASVETRGYEFERPKSDGFARPTPYFAPVDPFKEESGEVTSTPTSGGLPAFDRQPQVEYAPKPEENYTERYMAVDELYEALAMSKKRTDTIYLIEEYFKTLPDSLPEESKRDIVSKIVAASGFDYDLLMGDGVLRVKMLKEYAERFALYTEDYVSIRQAELDELDRQVARIRKLVEERRELHKKQFLTIEKEAQRLKEILTFIAG